MFSNRHPHSGWFSLLFSLSALRPFAAVSSFADVGRGGLLVRAAERSGE
jgi:hypothetical protein